MLEYNMQEMCNWKWCIVKEMYSMIVDYVLSKVDYSFNIVDYNFTLVDNIITLVDYLLISVENINSL